MRTTVEYRYYETPLDVPVLALLGEGWVRPYGELGLGSLHFHNLLEIGYCYEGEGQLALGDGITPYRAGTLSIVPRNVCHTTVSKDGMLCRNEYLFIDVDGFVASLPEEERRFGEKLSRHVNRGPLALSRDDNPALTGAVLSLIREMRQKQPFYQMGVKGLLLTLLIEIAREEMKREEPAEVRSAAGNKQRLLIKEALTFIDAHFNEEIRIADLAANCHLSETHLRRLFKSIMHMPPLEYLHIVRVEKACDLLRHTEYSMEIVAGSVGYFSISSFDRNFLRVTGLTPTQWRKSPDNYEQRLRNYQIAPFQGWR